MADLGTALSLAAMGRDLRGKYDECISPMCKDLGLLPGLCRTLGRSHGKEAMAVAVLFAYAPGSLIGGKIADGLRVAIARHLGVFPSTLSKIKKDAYWLYNNHRQYRQAVDSAITDVLKYFDYAKDDRRD